MTSKERVVKLEAKRIRLNPTGITVLMGFDAELKGFLRMFPGYKIRSGSKEEEEPRIQSKPETDQKPVSPTLGTRKILKVTKKINEVEKILNISLSNSVGYVLENIKIRVVSVEDLFEKRPWITTIKELFPFETIEIGYPLEVQDGEIVYENVLVEASTDEFGKIFSKSFKLTPPEEK